MPLSTKALEWQSTEQVIRQVPCTCVDGRTPGHRFSAAGGSLGIILSVLDACETERGQALSHAQTSAALVLFADRLGPVYLHSDTAAVTALLSRMGLRSDTPLSSLTPTQQRSFVELASQPDYQGCGHMRLMLSQPAEYGISTGLIEKSLRATLELWFAGHPAVLFEVLAGAHTESEVVLFDAQTSRPLEATTALADAPDRFFCHRPLKYELIRRFVAVLAAAGWTELSPEASTRIAQRHDEAAERTLASLASRLPVSHHDL